MIAQRATNEGDMGDMADFTLGNMAEHMWFSDRRKPQCGYCYKLAVYWEHTDQGWRLFNKANNSPHTCEEYIACKRRAL